LCPDCSEEEITRLRKGLERIQSHKRTNFAFGYEHTEQENEMFVLGYEAAEREIATIAKETLEGGK
jgi:hypothetical protein